MKRFKKLVLIMSLLPIMVLFTNCSGGFSAQGPESINDSSSVGTPPSTDTGGSTPTDPGAGGSIPPTTTPPTTTPPTTGNPPTTTPPTTTPPVEEPPATTPPTTTPPASTNPVAMLAVGHQARTVMSCDGGKTWINDRSDNDAARCYQGTECDHSATASMGTTATYANGYFYTQYGWGYDGTIRRSTDGKNWTTIRTGDWAGGIGANGNRVFSLWNDWTYSDDNGATWKTAKKSYSQWDMNLPLISQTKSKIFAVGRNDKTLQMAMSSDGGMNWAVVSGFKTEWGVSFAESSSGVLVSLGTTAGLIARSEDGGKTWTSLQAHSVNATWSSSLMYNGTQFVALAGGKRYVSTDGTAWTATAMVNPPGNGPSAYNPTTKTYSLILNEWNNYYASQKAWVSNDAITWTTLSSTAFKGGHPIIRIITAEVGTSVCP